MNWNDWILAMELPIRASAFAGVLCLMACWEQFAPRRKPVLSKLLRWRSNLSLVVINALLLRLMFPVAATVAAVMAAQNDWGLVPQLGLPFILAVGLSVVLLDLVIYLQHRVFHAVPFLWRLHRVHHADQDFDVTTGVRFHPLEILLSMLIKIATVLILGPPVVAVIVFEVILNASAMFNHGNINLPQRLDGILRRLIVTPDMHRVHHSVEPQETDRNFGFFLSAWDRLFRTYQAQPAEGHVGMQIGLRELTDPAQTSTITGMLVLPFSTGAIQAGEDHDR